jgi:Na+/pantothenate symporter
MIPTLFAAMAFLAMAATVAVLAAGVCTLAASDSFRTRYANLLMRWRVGLQGLAVLMLALSVATAGPT